MNEFDAIQFQTLTLLEVHNAHLHGEVKDSTFNTVLENVERVNRSLNSSQFDCESTFDCGLFDNPGNGEPMIGGNIPPYPRRRASLVPFN